MKPSILLVLVACVVAPITGDAQTADTLHSERPILSSGDAWVLAGFGVATAAALPADRWFTQQLQDPARQANRFMQRTATGARVWGNPGALIVSAGLFGAGTAAGNRRLQDLGLHTMGSVAVANAITVGLKLVTGRARPYVEGSDAGDFKLMRGFRSGDYRSFPSGHTTAAFAFAAVATAETSHWSGNARWPVGVLTYGVATLTGASRIYNYKHWASDAVAGAAIGTIAGLSVYRYQHSHPGNDIDEFFLKAGVQFAEGRWNILMAAASR